MSSDFENKISRKTALALTIFEYAAVSILAVAVICRLIELPGLGFLSVIGTALVASAPIAGVVTAGVISLKYRKYDLFAYSVVIISVYVIALAAAR